MDTESTILFQASGTFYSFATKDHFIETEEGNFHWSDPRYDDGDDTLVRFEGDLSDFVEQMNLPPPVPIGRHPIEINARPGSITLRTFS